jgi:aryl sulfotransferase
MTDNSNGNLLPARTRIYQNWVLDSTRWNYLSHRADDIVITTSYKAGTTWMQAIVGNLIFGGEPPAAVSDLSPFLEARMAPLEFVLTGLEAQMHRRFIKTHLPADGLPIDPRVKYVYVGRHPLDVYMSLWNHHNNYTDEVMAMMPQTGMVGTLPPTYENIHEMWCDWIGKGSFPWETDGYPYWSHFHHAETYWSGRHLPSICFSHYADLTANLEGEMRRIAAFLGINVPDSAWPRLVNNCRFESMREKGEKYAPNAGASWKGGAKTFFYKGGGGRWREVLSADELAQYEHVASEAVRPDCRRWLETGGPLP